MIETLGVLSLLVVTCVAGLALLALIYTVIVNHDRRQQAEQRMYEAAMRQRNAERADRVMTRSGALRAVDEGGSRSQRQDIDFVTASSAVLVNADYTARHISQDDPGCSSCTFEGTRSSHSHHDFSGVHAPSDSGGSYDSGSSYSGGSDF